LGRDSERIPEARKNGNNAVGSMHPAPAGPVAVKGTGTVKGTGIKFIIPVQNYREQLENFITRSTV